MWLTGHPAAGMRHLDTHLRPFIDAGQRRLQCVGGHARVDAARAQVIHLPAEDFFDAEADDVTVDQFVERNAEPLAFLILLEPGGGQPGDDGRFLAGVENLVAPASAAARLPYCAMSAKASFRQYRFGSGAAGAGGSTAGGAVVSGGRAASLGIP